jgi:hypothetical protein
MIYRVVNQEKLVKVVLLAIEARQFNIEDFLEYKGKKAYIQLRK